MDVSEKNLELLRHTLGATEKKRKNWGYRNYFCANNNETDPDYQGCRALERAGLMVAGNANKHSQYFHATEAGMKAIGFNEAQIEKAMED